MFNIILLPRGPGQFFLKKVLSEVEVNVVEVSAASSERSRTVSEVGNERSRQ